MLRKYDELIVWQKAIELVKAIYRVTLTFPKDESYGLTSQLRRAGISVPPNIAEGQGRKSTNEFLHHLSIAHGSLLEIETQVRIAEALEILDRDSSGSLMEMTAEVGRLINGLIRALKSKKSAPASHWPPATDDWPLNH